MPLITGLMSARVLYLTAWYPHRYDAMYGLFVRKHAVAAAKAGAEVCVLYLHPQDGTLDIDCRTEGSLTEITVYYRGSYLAALHRAWSYCRSHWGMPQLTQVNVVGRHALLALWLRRRYHIPYIVVEHWSGYLKQNGSYQRRSLPAQLFFRKVIASAERVLSVSRALTESMQSYGLANPHYGLIGNVVDDFFYNTQRHTSTTGTKTILHVSCFDERAKNIKGILSAIALLRQTELDFRLVVVGTGADYADVVGYCEQRGLTDIVEFLGELSPLQVADCYSRADVFVLFSHYETAGVVLAESIASGCPIVSTRVGIAPEVVNPQTGLLVDDNDEAGLAKALHYVLTHSSLYRSEEIRRQANEFTSSKIGKQLCRYYQLPNQN